MKVIGFCPFRGGLHVFSSIFKLVTRLLIHQQEDYGITLEPLHCKVCLVTSSLALVTMNSLGVH